MVKTETLGPDFIGLLGSESSSAGPYPEIPYSNVGF